MIYTKNYTGHYSQYTKVHCKYSIRHYNLLLQFRKLSRGFYFRETSHMLRSFLKIKSSQNGEITLLFTDIGKSCTSCNFLAPQECLLTLFTETKFLRYFRFYSIYNLKEYRNMYNWYKVIYDVKYIEVFKCFC